MHTFPTEVGLDYFRVDSSGSVTIQSVSFVGGIGGLKLVDASWAPGGGVGLFTYRPGHDTHLPAGFRSRIQMPLARLTPRHLNRDQLKTQPSGELYQLVVGVLPMADVAGARAAKVTYESDGHTHTVTGQVSVAFAQKPSACDAAANPP